MRTLFAILVALGAAAPGLAQPEVPPAAVQQQLCERALLVGGPLESYLEGIGLAGPTAQAKAQSLFEALRETHPELPESYLKLAVLMAAEGGVEATSEAAEATLRLLERCGEQAPAETPPAPVPSPSAETGAARAAPAGPAATVPAPPAPPTAPAAPPAEPPPVPAGSPRELFFQGVALAERGAFEEAKTIFRELIRSYPQLPEPYVNLGVLLAAEGDSEQAGQMAESALLAHPVCRAAFELTLLPKLSAHSYAVLADLGREGSDRVVGRLPQTPADVRAVAETVAAWSRAWSEGRLEDYLSFYAESFQPAAADRARWRAELRSRREVLESVALEDLSVDLTGPGKATAWFTHHGRNRGGGSVVVKKTLELVEIETAWKIVAERSGG